MAESLVIVFDTSVLIPHILPASRSTVLFHRLRASGHRVALTEPIYELEEHGVSALAGSFADDPTLREICADAYRQRDAEPLP